MINHAIVSFSGGQDSTTCLAWALNRFDKVHTVSFDYGQVHKVELECRTNILNKLAKMPQYKDKLGQDQIIDFSFIKELGQTAMTHEMEIVCTEQGLPNTFVPGRNLFFITAAASLAWRLNAKHIVLGVCETDFSGYPDCRDDTIKAMQIAVNLGLESRFVLHTPLMWIDKKQTWEMAQTEGGKDFFELIRTDSHTCYLGKRDELYEWGYGCGSCPACELRKKGYFEYVSS